MKKYLILLVLTIVGITNSFGQDTYYLSPQDDLTSCDKTKTNFYPNTSQEIMSYVVANNDLLSFQVDIGMFTLVSAMIEPGIVIQDHGCTYEFTRNYVISVHYPPSDEYPEGLYRTITASQRFIVHVWDSQHLVAGLHFTYETDGGAGFSVGDLPNKKTLEEWHSIYPSIQSTCGNIEGLEMTCDTDSEPESDDGCTVVYVRHYEIVDKCVPLGDVVVATIDERVSMTTELKITGKLKTKTLIQNEAPPTYNSATDLTKAGLKVRYSRSLAELSVRSEEIPTNYPNRRQVKIFVSSPCESIEEVVLTQDCYVKIVSAVPFKIFYTESTMDGLDDGTFELYLPPLDEGCSDYPGDSRQWYTVRLKNLDTEEEQDISETLTAEDLARGEYRVTVFPTCPDCEFYGIDTVFSEKFKIDSRKMDMRVTDGYGLWNGNYYSTYHLLLNVERDDGSYVPFEEYDSFVGRFDDEWSLMTGKIYSPRSGKQFDAFEMFNIHMDGLGMYEHIMFHYHLVNDEFSHGLQRMIIAKNEKRRATYTLRKPNGEVFLHPVYKDVYGEDLICAVDPNEIYGPAGYTAEDSTVVRMINANDNVNYTIQFENDPEFATAAAARVKIVCPLDEHADPTSFHLGNFGFGSHTFEVPPMTNYYNKRINMDSLGYWLDVTAILEMPQKNALWIFQTIDPATGMSPIDSLGFLPVNDTLTGEGEGFVTFSVTPIGGGRSQVMTGDTIVEQADIFFDENEVVATNRYKNTFDAVAPTSTIVCDTTGAFASRMLNLGFHAEDDPGGSGVDYVELYANIDQAGFVKVGTIDADSIFSYSLNQGSNFGFMCLAVDHVGNREAFKPYEELTYSLGNAPYDLTISNNVFAENDPLGTSIGTFSTFDDQNTDFFVYALVPSSGGNDNNLFTLEGNNLKTNHDFRCYGNYEYRIRVRTTDVTNYSLEKEFTLYAQQTENIPVTNAYTYLCPGEAIMIAGTPVSTEGIYYDTLSSVLGCDSVVCHIVRNTPVHDTEVFADDICYGDDYTNNGFDISADSLAVLTAGWNMQDDVVLNMENYKQNTYGCYDTTRLTLTVHSSFEDVTDVRVCELDLPYLFKGFPFYRDTTLAWNYLNASGCDSIYSLILKVNPEQQQEHDFNAGWNWFSTNLDQNNGQGLIDFENALNGNATLIKSHTSFTNYDPTTGLWFGNLDDLENKTMYLVNMVNPYLVSQSGCPAEADTINLNPGWNWIGYPMGDTTYVSQLSAAIVGGPAHNDLIKSKTAFATYDANFATWFGSLDYLRPGDGYMYQSQSSEVKPLYYPNRSSRSHHALDIPEAHWTAEHSKFANNLTLTGTIWLDDMLVESDTLEVGAFVNGEQRGSGRAVYIEQMDAYRIFLTIHGEEGDAVNFRLFNHNRGKERRIRCAEQLTFHADNNYGTLDKPYSIHFLTDYDLHIQAEICEGEYYTEHNFRVYESGTYYQELTTELGNDSIVRLDLTVNPVYHVEEEVVATGFPFEYQGMTFASAGTYTMPFTTETMCDSVWVVKVIPYEGQRELLVSPLPALRTQKVNLYFPFTPQEQQDIVVEVYTMSGSLLQSYKPIHFPIEIGPFPTAGTYMVKIIMGTEEELVGKIIVR